MGNINGLGKEWTLKEESWLRRDNEKESHGKN